MAHQGAVEAGNEIKVTFVTTEHVDSSSQGHFHALLDDSEREHLRRLRNESSRCEYLCAHTRLRIGLSSICRVAPMAWRFGRDHFGKPRIEYPVMADKPAFNLSHTASLVGCAFAPAGLVGFDIERTDRFSADTHAATELADTVDLVFSEREKAAWLSLEPASHRAARFYRLWTMKEALLKAAGRGLTLKPSAICIDMHDEAAPVVKGLPAEIGDPGAWFVRSLFPAPSHVAAIAVKGGRGCMPEIQSETIDPHDLSRLLSDLKRGLALP
jgi:4'-phosphopantetheinyl transferase